MGYIRGFDGRCCNSCAPANACAQKPETNTSSVSQSIGPVTAGSYVGAVIVTSGWPWFGAGSFTATGLPSGMSISSGGTVSGTAPETNGYYTFYATGTNSCGTGTRAIWLIVEGGTPGPCDLGVVSLGTSGSGSPTDTYDVTGRFVDSHSMYLRATISGFAGPITCRFRFSFNGSVLYDTGYVTATLLSLSTTVTAPAGTTSISVQIECDRTPYDEGGWNYVVCCSGDCS